MNHLTLQLKLEALYNKNQLLPRLTEMFQEEPEFKAVAMEYKIPYPLVIAALVQMSIHKQANLPTMVGLLHYITQDSQLTADLLWKCVEADLFGWNESTNKFVVHYELSEEQQAAINIYMYPPPMVVEPRTVTNNKENGYFLTHGSLILKTNHHNEDICLDHINRINKVKLSLNQHIATTVTNTWKGIDTRKPHESFAQFKQRQATFVKFNKVALDYIELVQGFDNEIHLTHKYDKRGRTYAQGYYINYQGNPWSKAIVEFANKEIIKD